MSNIKKNMIKMDDNNLQDIKNKKISSHDMIKADEIELLQNNLIESNQKVLDEKRNSELEILNISNRLEQNIEKTRKFCLEKDISSFLPIIDNLNSALNTLNNNKKNQIYDLILKKIVLVLKIFQEIFDEYEVKEIDEIKVPFNPEIHQAMAIDYHSDIPENQVIKVIQSGYILHQSRLLRPAMVIVSKEN